MLLIAPRDGHLFIDQVMYDTNMVGRYRIPLQYGCSYYSPTNDKLLNYYSVCTTLKG